MVIGNGSGEWEAVQGFRSRTLSLSPTMMWSRERESAVACMEEQANDDDTPTPIIPVLLG
jgi:hypothetical protein